MDWNSIRVLASLVSCVVTVNINESVVRIYDCYVLAKNCCTAFMHHKDNQQGILYIEVYFRQYHTNIAVQDT